MGGVLIYSRRHSDHVVMVNYIGDVQEADIHISLAHTLPRPASFQEEINDQARLSAALLGGAHVVVM